MKVIRKDFGSIPNGERHPVVATEYHYLNNRAFACNIRVRENGEEYVDLSTHHEITVAEFNERTA